MKGRNPARITNLYKKHIPKGEGILEKLFMRFGTTKFTAQEAIKDIVGLHTDTVESASKLLDNLRGRDCFEFRFVSRGPRTSSGEAVLWSFMVRKDMQFRKELHHV